MGNFCTCTYSPQEGKWHDVIDKFEELSVEANIDGTYQLWLTRVSNLFY